MSRGLKVLWMIPKWTLPATDGARVATDRLLKNTVKAGVEVDCLFVLPKGEAGDPSQVRKAWNVNKIKIVERYYPTAPVKRALNFLKLFIFNPFVPLTISSFYESKVKDRVWRELEQEEYDVLVLDALHLAACFYDGVRFIWPSSIKKIVLREHNFEQELWTKAAIEEANIIKKLLLKFQANRIQQFENDCLAAVDAIAAISAEDLEKIKSISPSVRSELIPLGLNFSRPLDDSHIKKGRFLFVGRLDWPPNRDGLEWFLDNVWNEVANKYPNFELQIVGSGNKTWREKYRGKKGLVIQGFIADIDDAYKEAEFTLIPMRYGSGTRIKVIETYAKGRPILTTKMGIQGAGLDETKVPLAENKEEWIELLSTLDRDRIMKDFEHNRKHLASKFDEVEIGAHFQRWLTELL